ncbi:MAG: hypothetical protein QOE92_111 [Chloroflexota bacterium]|jgi:DNA-directed RNA polymerase subunit RPC12/RpoP|nr:hypothetical protein [Chloroflexota bacterium]
MPRRRPPVDIFTFPLPSGKNNQTARCPQCGGEGQSIGHVGARLVYQCGECAVRFKSDHVDSLQTRDAADRP